MEEQVLVVPREVLFVDGTPHGFTPREPSLYLERIRAAGRFVARGSAEGDPSLKQIIPYGLLTARSRPAAPVPPARLGGAATSPGEGRKAPGDTLVFCLERSARGGDARLHHRVSIGVGGHVNPEDLDPAAPSDLALAVDRAFAREVREEIDLASPFTQTAIGFLNDESNSVGSVHLGLVYRLDLREPAARVRETEVLSGGFLDTRALADRRERMETWSRILFDALWAGTST